MHLWMPKAKVTIVELKEGLFSFGFDSKRERAMVQKRGPWLFDGGLLALAEADSLAQSDNIPLSCQEFWIQIKGLPLAYMTRHMGQFVGNQRGKHDQSRKSELLGSILRIRAEMDIKKPFRRSLLPVLEGNTVKITLRYEKVPFTCYLCGMTGHMEENCLQFKGKNDDDSAKPYG